jgi:hypothetical protein
MSAGPSDEQQSLYRLAFVKNCFILVVRAYLGLDAGSLRVAEETHITGELVRFAKALIESDAAEPWMEHMEVMDDPPQNVAGRYGKQRPRIDIEFMRTGRGRRPRFHIEAKRVYRSDSVNEYLGPSGLQMFILGQYAGGWPSAGMIGYVQSDTCAVWLGRIASGLAARRAELRVCEESPEWTSAGWDGDLVDSVHVSHHERGAQEPGRIRVFHLLLGVM